MRKILVVILGFLMIAISLSGCTENSGEQKGNIDLKTTASFAGGNGTKNNPYQITHIEHLYNIRENHKEFFILINDLDFNNDDNYLHIENKPDNNSGDGWLPISTFNGNFDGQNHKINNLFINRSEIEFIGLFGKISSGSKINRLGLVDIEILGDSYVGGIAGRNQGYISNSYSKGSVIGADYGYIGGLVGENQGSIYKSYTMGNVTGDSYVGGLVGYSHSGSISNCYSTSFVTGSYYDAGGLVGSNAGSINNSYATGKVTTGKGYYAGGLVGTNDGGVINSFYNNETSGQTRGIAFDYTSSVVTGKSTENMLKYETFENAGWDIEKIEDYDNEIWFIDEDNDYPSLGPDK